MRLLAAIAALAALAAAAAHAAPLGYEGARHLLDRTGFGATDREVREFAQLDRAQAVERLIAGARREAVTPPPAFATASFEPYAPLKPDGSPEERMAYAAQARAARASSCAPGGWARCWPRPVPSPSA